LRVLELEAWVQQKNGAAQNKNQEKAKASRQQTAITTQRNQK